MARPRATPEQRAEQRDRLRQAASELYRESGPAGITVRAVSDRAGVSQGTLYSYFDNLADLMRSLWAEPVARADAELDALAEAHDDPIERVRALLEGYVRFARDNERVYRGAVMYVRPADAPTPVRQPPETLAFFRRLREAVAEAAEAGRIEQRDPHIAAQLLWAAVHGAISLPVHLDLYELDPPDKLAAAMIDEALARLGGRAEGAITDR